MIEIRESIPAHAKDAAEIVAFATADLRRVYRPLPGGKPTSRQAEESFVTLVAVEGDLVVGVAEYCPRAAEVHVRGLAVHPRWRRRGIGRALVGGVAEVAVALGKRALTLSTIKETGNPAIFERLGFVAMREAPAEGFQGPDGTQVTRVDMHRLLV